MAYVNSRKAGRPSTTLISSRIQRRHIKFAEDNEYNFNRWVNKAMETFVHDLQTDYNINRERYWLTYSGGGFTGYDTDYTGGIPKMLRLQTHLIEYFKMNSYKVNTAINLALQRWEEYFKNGKVADYVIGELKRTKRASAKEEEKPKQENPPKVWTMCGNCIFWRPKNRRIDAKAHCIHPKMNCDKYRASFCDHFARCLESD